MKQTMHPVSQMAALIGFWYFFFICHAPRFMQASFFILSRTTLKAYKQNLSLD